MKKLDLVLENIRDEYMINVLEEGTTTELEALKTKKFLNESIQSIRGILVQEGVMPAVQNHLANNWKKYLAGGATAAMMASDPAQDAARAGVEDIQNIAAADGDFGTKALAGAQAIGGRVADAVGTGVDSAIATGTNALDSIGAGANQAADYIETNTTNTGSYDVDYLNKALADGSLPQEQYNNIMAHRRG